MQKNFFLSNFPSAFVQRMQSELGNEYPEFEESLRESPPVSVRYNPFKPCSIFPSVEKVAWSEYAYYLPERPVFTLEPLFHAGAYYVQEASSMLLGNVFSRIFPTPSGLSVLDLCAAPGGKSTDILSRLRGNDNILVCNEVVKKRVPILMDNLQKWGCSNVFVCSEEPQKLTSCGVQFDAIVVDAPCSGEGLFRKDPNAVNEWSPQNLRLCETRQKNILDAAHSLLKEGGYLFYSTCTFNPQENEENCRYLTDKYNMEEIRFDFPEEWGITSQQHGYQCYPHKTKGEGFYLAVMKKTEQNSEIKPHKYNLQKSSFVDIEWMQSSDKWQVIPYKDNDCFIVKERFTSFYEQISKRIRLTPTLSVSKVKNDFLPTHSLALSLDVLDSIPCMELALSEALRFLKKDTVEYQKQEKGWKLITYQHQKLGWVKVLDNRINNYLPKEFRIRMSIDNE